MRTGIATIPKLMTPFQIERGIGDTSRTAHPARDLSRAALPRDCNRPG
jgi:hypothetical protein